MIGHDGGTSGLSDGNGNDDDDAEALGWDSVLGEGANIAGEDRELMKK